MRTLWVIAVCAMTGCSPSESGSIAPKDRVVVLISLSGFPAQALQDSNVRAPTLLRLSREGATAAALIPVDPTVSWPNHSALATGVASPKHRVLYNGLLVREGPRAGVRVRSCSRAEILQIQTFYDLAHDAGFTTAQVGWVPGQAEGTITWGFGELPSPKGTIEREMMEAQTLSDADMEEVGKTTSLKRDDVWFKVAAHVIDHHRPGVLLLRFTDLDATFHKYGAGTPESREAITAADKRVSGILDSLDRSGLLKRATVFVVSDQGFKTVHRHIRPNAALRAAGLLVVKGPKMAPQVVSADAHAMTAGGIATVFVTDPDRRNELKTQVREILSGLEGVERVLDPASDPVPGCPDPKASDQVGDLVIHAKPGYGFIAASDGDPVGDVTPGSTIAFHGYPSTDPDMEGLFIAWGRGVRSGVHLGKIRNLDVAPTISRVLGLTLDAAEGHVLTDILK